MNGGVRRPLKGVNARLPRSGGTSPRLSRLPSVRSPKRWRIPHPAAGRPRSPALERRGLLGPLAWHGGGHRRARNSPRATADHARLVSIPGSRTFLQAIPHRRSRSRTPLVGTCPDWPSRSGCSPAEWPTRECILGCTTRATSRSARSSEPARRSWWQQSSTRFGASSCGSSRSTGALMAAHRAGWGRSLIPTMGRGRHPSLASGGFVCSTHASAPGNTMVS